MLTATEGELERNSVEDGPGSTSANGGTTLEATFEDTDAAGAGGCHGAGKRER